MKKLIQLFKGLPPEVRLLVAMAGLGTPLGAIYVLKRIFPHTSTFVLILIVAGVVAAISLLGWLITWLFGRGRRKRSKKMAAELAGQAESGRAAMDVRASIKANNDKYFAAIRDMRKNLRIDVYDLPWYIVMGDSGCGKTRLINEGGLTFSTGKPEGYQLGTLNYNWWFTEDAIFIDMAGRLCNPQEDADRREWEAFLGTVGQGRRGFPINGALVCVSADHLLQDAPEKIEQDANTSLERLRDLQTRLGVTFATYLIVTKCDKILGFMQFFDRAERDITFKNQIFGWSKPGNFNELYDPERFAEDFDRLYERLNDLRLRRMHDEADEIDLGLAYSFPGEFRQMLPPLQTYLRTLFPMIKSPRAIKNLVFRGAYFTSATQEGALILKHLTERLGAEAAAQFSPLDTLYPTKRPHFIKDLLFKKVFPEHGLVFRNEQQALRNQKLSQLLKVGSIALLVLFFGMGAMSTYKFSKVIGDPREHAKQTTPSIEFTPSKAVDQSAVLGTDVASLEGSTVWANVLSFGRASAPIRDLKIIRAGLFEQRLLGPALSDVGQALTSTKLGDPRDGPAAQQTAQKYMDALEQYLAWYGRIGETDPPKELTYDGFKKLCAVVTDPGSVVKQKGFDEQATEYFNVVKTGAWGRNPARLLSEKPLNPQETIQKALTAVHGYLSGYARLDETHPDQVIAEWMRIRAQCANLKTAYDKMLNAAGENPQTLDALQEFKNRFEGSYGTFATALADVKWKGPSSGQRTIIGSLREALLKQRDLWVVYETKIQQAYSSGSTSPGDVEVGKMIAALGAGSDRLPGLDRVLWDSLRKSELTDKDYHVNYLAPEIFMKVVREVHDLYAGIISFKPSQDGVDSDHLERTAEARAVAAVLQEVHDHLALEPSGDTGTPAQWIEDLDEYFDKGIERSPPAELETLPPVWRPEELSNLEATHLKLIARGKGRLLLESIDNRLSKVAEHPWGVAELVPEWNGTVSSEFHIDIPRSADEREDRKAGRSKPPKEEDKEKPRGQDRRSPRGRRGSEGRPPPAAPAAGVTKGGGEIPTCASPRFLAKRAEECALLLGDLRAFDADWYFSSAKDQKPLHELCVEHLTMACKAYMKTYATQWGQAYKDHELKKMKRLLEEAPDWKSLTERIKDPRTRDAVADELRPAMEEIFGAVPFWGWTVDESTTEWVPETEGDEDWQKVASWMGSAIKQTGELSWFVGVGEASLSAAIRKDSKSNKTSPWAVLSDRFVAHWRKLADDIGLNMALPRTFPKDPTPRPAITWGEIVKLREEARLTDEKLTGQLAEFEKQAQHLLSLELTGILCEVQDHYFKEESKRVFDGWPYLDKEGSGAGALRTVEYKKFGDFLVEAGRAHKAFEPLEKGLGKEEYSGARGTFYQSCEEWSDFLKLNATDTSLKPLKFQAKVVDPQLVKPRGVQVDDTAQNYYGEVDLNLGSEPPVLQIPTRLEERDKLPEAKWDWSSRVSAPPLKVELVKGAKLLGAASECPSLDEVLGEASELALCAYLHRYGEPRGSDWITTHSFELEKRFTEQKRPDLVKLLQGSNTKVVGLSLQFTLPGRSLPPPITKLERAAEVKPASGQ